MQIRQQRDKETLIEICWFCVCGCADSHHFGTPCAHHSANSGVRKYNQNQHNDDGKPCRNDMTERHPEMLSKIACGIWWFVLEGSIYQVKPLAEDKHGDMFIFTYIHTYIHTCMHACMHARTHARTHRHTYIHTYITYITYIHTLIH